MFWGAILQLQCNLYLDATGAARDYKSFRLQPCSYCSPDPDGVGEPLVDAEHFLFGCPHWSEQREELKNAIGEDQMCLEEVFNHATEISKFLAGTIFDSSKEDASQSSICSHSDSEP